MNKNQSVELTRDRVTIRHVAEDAGVSVAAVSKVLRNAYGVSEVLRTKVQNSIGKLNYRPSTAARAMRGRTNTFGVLAIELSNPFLPGVIEAANAALLEYNFKSLIGLGHSATMIEATMIESMIDNRMDGVLIIAPRISSDVLERYAKDIPIVVIAHHEPHAETFDTVNSDDRQGAVLAVEAALAAGYSELAMLSYENAELPSAVVARQREWGYLEAMQRAGKEARILRLPPMELDRTEEIARFIASLIVPAPFSSGRISMRCRSSMRREFQAFAFQKISRSSDMITPRCPPSLIGLSSIDQNAELLGRTAIKLLLERIDGRTSARHVLIEPHMEIRGSI